MGTTWAVRNLDLSAYAGKTIYYFVGDAADYSKVYQFRVPPLPGTSKSIQFIACAFRPSPPRCCARLCCRL